MRFRKRREGRFDMDIRLMQRHDYEEFKGRK